MRRMLGHAWTQGCTSARVYDAVLPVDMPLVSPSVARAPAHEAECANLAVAISALVMALPACRLPSTWANRLADKLMTSHARVCRYPHVNGRLAPASPPQLQASPTKRQLTRIRCVCGVTADRGRMIQCQVPFLLPLHGFARYCSHLRTDAQASSSDVMLSLNASARTHEPRLPHVCFASSAVDENL